MMNSSPFRSIRPALAPLTSVFGLAVAVFGLAIAAPACAPAAPTQQAPEPVSPAADATWEAESGEDLPFWEVTQDGRTVYLLGSVHLLTPDVYPLDDVIYDAFEDADLVAFELDFDLMMEAAPVMMERGMYADGRTLGDVLPAELHAELVERVGETPLPMEVVEQMKPWMASMTLTSMILQQGGFTAAEGIDLHFHERAKEAGTEVIGLETLEEQLAVFDDLDEDAQIAFLRSTLEQLDDAVEQMNRATLLWQRGDVEGLAGMFIEQMGEQPELLDRLLYARNRNWVPEIEALFERPETAFVVVGVGHLVGEGSVIDLLRERGYQVTQVRSESPVPVGASGGSGGAGPYGSSLEHRSELP